MIAAPCSTSASTCGARSSMLATAVPTKIENTTICRISFLARASKIEAGTRWVRKSFSVKLVTSTPLAVAATSGAFSDSPEPGCSRWTMIRPMVSEMIEAEMNQAMVLAPIRPMAAASSMWAIPATRVVNTRGAMIILINRRKTSVTRLRLPATVLTPAGSSSWLQAKPTATPRTIAATMKYVNVRLMRTPGCAN